MKSELEVQDLKQTEEFTYLGGVWKEQADVKRYEAKNRHIKGIFQMLSKIWAAKDLSKALKIEVFEVLVLSSLLYYSETWVIKATFRNLEVESF